jgi:hypothetical protein
LHFAQTLDQAVAEGHDVALDLIDFFFDLARVEARCAIELFDSIAAAVDQ